MGSSETYGRGPTLTTIQAPADSLVRAHGRGLLFSILEKEVLLTQLKVAPGGHFVAETMGWISYWEPLQELGCRKVEHSLEALRSAWRDHIRSGLGSSMRREFCFRYFFLLDVLLSNYSGGAASNEWGQALQTVLGFECLGLTTTASNSEVLGAGTSTLRNPCYLLAKLKRSGTLDDPQFLPLINYRCA